MRNPWASKLIAIIAIVTAAVLGLGLSCKKEEKVKKGPFVIGFNEWVGFAPFYLAKEKGYFGDLDVSLNFIELEGDKRAGLYSGRFQMICETTDMFQTNRDNAAYPGKVVFAVDESLGGDGVVASADVKTLSDLKGKTVVSEPGLPAHFVLQYLLHKEGMTMDDIDVQEMTSADAASAFIAGKADVAGTYEPYLTKALNKRAGAHLLVSTKDLPGLIIDVGIVTDETLAKRPEDVKVVYDGWCKAVKDLQTNPDDVVPIMAKAFKMSPQEFNETRSGLRYIDVAENRKLFGTKTNRGTIFTTFDLAGEILSENRLTKATAPSSLKVETSVVSPPAK